MVLIRGLNGIPIYLRFRFTFWQGSAIKEVPKCLGTTYKSKICQEPNNIFFCSFLCNFLAHYAATTEVWNELWHCLCGKTKITPLSPCFLFSEWETFLWYLDSPRATYLTQKLSLVSIQIVFEQKYSFLHDVYLTNIWMWCYSYTSFSCSCR